MDIEKRELHLFDPAAGQEQRFSTGARVGTVVPQPDSNVLVALQTGIHRLNTTSGDLTLLVNPLEEPTLRFNDGKCDPAGRFWVGTFDLLERPGSGTLYCFDPDGSLHVVLRPVTNSNGLAWSLDQTTFHYIGTPTYTAQAFD